MRCAIIGVGSIIYQDEGIGVYASKYIEKNYTFEDDVTVVDGGVLGFNLMSYYQDFDKVVIVDTITLDDEVGSIFNIPAQELMGLGSYKQSAHEVEVVEMLEICSLLGEMAEVNVIGIVPQDIKSVKIALTPQMQEKFEHFITAALGELSQSGIRFSKNSVEHPLDDIIREYALK